ncbi:MAG: phosphatase PAP2 family protein [Pseudomonadota bacterium]|nr:phosphatase PAP2 family protein [Pseudomonadota bacterium]
MTNLVATAGSTATEGAPLAGTRLVISPELASAVSNIQTGFDPYAPWVLAAVLLLAVWALARLRARRPGLTGGDTRGLSVSGLAPAWCWACVPALAWVPLAIAVQLGAPWVMRLDAWATRAVQGWGAPVSLWAARLSDMGDVLVLTVLTVVVAAVLLRRHQRLLVGAWLLGITANSLAIRVLKNLFERARPAHAPDLVTSGFSFPSGHAASALMVYGLLAWVLCDQWQPRWRWPIAGLAALLVAGIAASRVLLGVHYLSDVLGGLLWAATALLLTVGAVQQARRW